MNRWPLLAVLAAAGCATPAPKVPARPSAGPGARPPLRAVLPPAVPPAAVSIVPPSVSSGPVVLSSLPNLNDFTLLANGGWNANWFVGYNTCWVHRLPPAPPGDYRRAFLGAKLGAMKTESIPGRPSWERRVVPGEISIAVAAEPSWPQSQRYALTDTSRIPLAGDRDNALEGVGEARWFWVEVPLSAVSFDAPNYVALYSPDDTLRDENRSPILAGGPSDNDVDTWLNNTVQGQPPLTAAEALKTPVGSYEPAVALKLVPARDDRPRVAWRRPPPPGAEVPPSVVLEAEVSGTDVACAWVEISTDTRTWTPFGRPQWGAPFAFTLTRQALPRGVVRVRAAARDPWENTGVSPILTLRNSKK